MFQIVAYGPTVYRTGEFALILSDEMVNRDFLKISNQCTDCHSYFLQYELVNI